METLEQAGPVGWLVMIDAGSQAIYLDRKSRQSHPGGLDRTIPFGEELSRRR